MLIVASAAFAKVSARRRHPFRRSLQYRIQFGIRIAATVFADVRLNHLAGQRERNEDGLPISARQPRTAVNSFFDPQLHYHWLM